jgi:hypothetical protein
MDLKEIGWESVDLIGLAQERDPGRGGPCEDDNEVSVSMRCRNFLDLLRNCLLFKRYSMIWSWLVTCSLLVNSTNRLYMSTSYFTLTT